MKTEASGMHVPDQGFDFDRLAEISGGDPEFEREIITEYLTQAEELLAAIARALEIADATELKRAAHTLKGSSMTVGASAVAVIGADLERVAAGSDLSAVTGLLARAGAVLARTREQLDDHFGSDTFQRAG